EDGGEPHSALHYPRRRLMHGSLASQPRVSRGSLDRATTPKRATLSDVPRVSGVAAVAQHKRCAHSQVADTVGIAK
ncbi:MAG TPA: hypothetical protein VK673_21030, partial [Chthoniobacterales bacterium]|nr:hypothetical protein [Chthoniobacterales bacterium]